MFPVRTALRLFALTIVLAVSTHPLYAACPGFSVIGTKTAGNGPWFAAAGDLDSDGDSDIVVANYEANTVSVFPGNGDGTFANKVDYVTGFGSSAPTIANLNGDAHPDIAVSHGAGIAVLLNKGNGTFATAAHYGTTSGFNAAADIDNDGDRDLIGVSNVDTAFVLLNNGNGTFADGATYAVGTSPNGIVAAHFNADANVDLAVSNFFSADVSVLLGNGNGTFAAAVAYPVGFPKALAAADVNGNGAIDIITANYGDAGLAVLLGNGNGTFGAATAFPAGEPLYAIAIADLTGDGILDVAAPANLSNSMRVFAGNGSGAFTASMSIAIGAGSVPNGVAAADFNGDASIDLVSANYLSDSISILLNGCTTFATIDTVAPTAGPAAGAQSVVIAGMNLTGATSVTFGGTAATITNNTATTITVATPAHAAGAVDVVVTAPAGTATKTSAYSYVEAPTITSVSPSSGRTTGTQNVTITGTNLQNISVVSFGGTNATVSSSNATNAIVVRPAHAAGVVDVVLTTAGGTATLTGGYTYVPAPTATSINPSSGPIAGGQSVTIGGTNLSNPTSVTFGGTASTITNHTPTSVTVTTPARAAGSVSVVVTTAGGTATRTYTYVNPPSLTAINPNTAGSAGGESATITGTALSNATVTFDGTPATINSNNATTIVCTVPPHLAGAVSVVVATAGGSASLPFTYIAAPNLSSLAPTAGPTAGGQTVVINGTNLANVTSVSFDGLAAAITNSTSTAITVTTPPHAEGHVNVTVTTPGGTRTLLFAYAYVAPPSLTTIVPAVGRTSGGQSVQINGSKLADATSVTFGGTPASIGAKTSSSIAVTTPPHAAGAVDVIVTTPGGTATQTFTYIAAPAITSVVPNAGPAAGGQTVVVTGNDLTNATVTFDGTTAAITSNTTASITVTSPPHAAAVVNVVVTTAGGAASATYSYIAPPAITSLTPNNGPTIGGQSVVIAGSDFANATVTFDGTTVAIINNTASSITVTSPPHAPGVVDVVVTTAGGAASATYSYIAPPAITSLTPSNGPTIGGQAVVIAGSDLTNASVTFDGTIAAITNNTGSSITVNSPPHAAGVVDVVVTTAGGTASATYSYIAPPAITSLTPNNGPTIGGQSVVINGSDLTNATVTFDGTPVAIINNTASSITITSPPHTAGVVDVVVTTVGGTATNTYTYIAAPAITSLTPNNGPTIGGQTVVIAGNDLTNATITFDGATVVITNNTASSITVTSPPHAAGVVDVVVTTAGGTASATYTYIAAPAITSLTPNNGPTIGGQSVVINGSDLTDASVTFDGITAAITNNTAASITVTSPPHAAGVVDVVVTTVGGTTSATYSYIAAPAITSLTPNNGPTIGGQTIVIAGNDLTNTSVAFDGTTAAITNNTATSITVTSPPHAAGVVDVVVTTVGGTATVTYTYIAGPAVTSLTPNNGPTAGGQSVVINGVDLSNATVTFDGTPAPIINNTTSSITVTSPPHAAGTVDVVVTTTGGTATGTYTYIAAPAITSLTPNHGPTAGGQTIVVNGNDLTNASITFDGTTAPITNNTSTTIEATTPPHAAGIVNVLVTTTGGTASSTYTYLPPPSIVSILPTVGAPSGGQLVTITGANLGPNAIVMFGSVQATPAQRLSASVITVAPLSLQVLAPAHAPGLVDITVITDGGSFTSPAAFLYAAAAVAESITPSSGPTTGGQVATISGTDLLGAISVTFDGIAATITGNTATTITVITPPHASGAVDVVITTASDSSTMPGAYTYVAAAAATAQVPTLSTWMLLAMLLSMGIVAVMKLR